MICTIHEMKRHRIFLSSVLLLAGWALPVFAQWETQEVPLQAGWQAVHLRVAPAVDSCADVFGGTDVESVHWWRRETTREEFSLDVNTLFPRRADWEVWYADDPDLSTFSRLLPGETYLIKVASNASPWVQNIPGRVLLNPIEWIPAELNLVGLPASSNTTFGQFFYFTDEITANSSTGTIFRVDTNGQPERIFLPWSTLIEPGEACWVQAGPQTRQYEGPVRVWMESGVRLLDFGQSTMPRVLFIENRTGAERTIQLTHAPSEAPPAGAMPSLGRPALRYRADAITGAYAPLPDVLVTNVPAGETLRISLAPNAAAMTNTVDEAARWQSILEIMDAGNTEYAVATVRHRIGVVCDGNIGALSNPAGLWVGEVTVNGVSRAPARLGADSSWDSTTPLAVSESFRFRLIIHVDENGQARLLQRVLMAWRPDGEVVETVAGAFTNGVVELLTDDALAEDYVTANPDATIHRLSSVNLPLSGPWLMTGAFGSGQTLTVLVDLPFDDAVNPFVHRYHPQHDNLDYLNDAPVALEEGAESYTVTRDMQFTFLSDDPDAGGTSLLWGTEEMGGDFAEHIDGLNKTLYVEGRFRLRRVSDASALMDE
ncbi:MAG: hypothetical protein EOM20_05365 [Spartobacteria bacterium]|nr:hypothetical protein [Spartobacteria bacterium]